MTYMKTDIPTHLDVLTPRVLEAYINSRLASVEEDSEEDGIVSLAFSSTSELHGHLRYDLIAHASRFLAKR